MRQSPAVRADCAGTRLPPISGFRPAHSMSGFAKDGCPMPPFGCGKLCFGTASSLTPLSMRSLMPAATTIAGAITVARVRLLHVETFRDRHGRERRYFRKGRGKRYPLPGSPGSPEFMTAYQAAFAAEEGRRAPNLPGSIGVLVADYLASPGFLRLKTSSQEVTQRILHRFSAVNGHRSVAGMKRAHVDQLIATVASKPAAANNLLKKLRVLFRFAIARQVRTDDPTVGIARFREGEHHTWTEDEIAKFEARWPVGTRERTAFAIHLYTGIRRTDGCRLRWTDMASARVKIKQEKTGKPIDVPMHPELQRALAVWPRRHFVVISSTKGKPFTPESYGNWMADAIDAAGLPPRCVLHGLRKALARRLAEDGCTEKQIAAVTGHQTLSEVARYTRAASEAGLADAAILRLRKPGLGNEK